jgi:hypothetical protein
VSWRSKIEAQIAKCREKYHGGYADTMQALLDVAVAADAYERLGLQRDECNLIIALDKLRELDT